VRVSNLPADCLIAFDDDSTWLHSIRFNSTRLDSIRCHSTWLFPAFPPHFPFSWQKAALINHWPSVSPPELIYSVSINFPAFMPAALATKFCLAKSQGLIGDSLNFELAESPGNRKFVKCFGVKVWKWPEKCVWGNLIRLDGIFTPVFEPLLSNILRSKVSFWGGHTGANRR